MKHHLKALAIVIVTVLLAPLGTVGPSYAADNGAWSVTPTPPQGGTAAPRTYFILEGDPGTTIKDKVRIQNWTKKPITFKLYGADAYNTEQDGFFALRNHGEKMTDIGRWAKPLISQVTVHGRTQVDVPVTIKIPRNASPGDHIGGIVAMNAKIESAGDSDSSVDVGIQRAVAARVYLRVSGPTTPALEVSDVELEHDRGIFPWTGSGKGTVTYTLRNTGNIRLTPTAALTLSGMFGEIESLDAEGLPELLPGQEVTLSEAVSSVPAFGRVTTDVEVTTAEGPESSGSTTTWLVPWPGLVLVLLLVGVAAWWLARRRGSAQRRLDALHEAPQIMVPSNQ